MAQLRVRAKPGKQRVDTAAIRQVANGSGVRRDLKRRADRVAAYTRISIPMRTGKLRSSVRIDEVQRGANPGVQVLVGRGVSYSSAYLFGAKPHVIRPRRKKALRFVAGGRVVFARQVNHPGWRGNNVLEDAKTRWRN